MIRVRTEIEAPDWICQVEISGRGPATQHRVRVTPGDLERWGRGGSAEELVRRSFEFLLRREPPESILSSFQVADIQRYFPEFDSLMS